MTKGEAPTTAEQAQAPADTAVTENTAAETATTEEAASAPQQDASTARLNAAELAAMAAAAAEMDAPVEEEAPAQLASAAEAQAKAAAKAEADLDGKKEDEDAEAQDAPVDLAMAPDAEIFEAIAAADGARAVAGEEGEGEASALGGDGGVPPVGIILGAAIAGGALYLALDDDDDDREAPPPPPPPPPPPANVAPEFTSGATAEVDENVAVETVVYDAEATDADGDDITYSLAGDDAAAFTIDAATGEVRFVASPDFETQASYDITVVATDSEDNATEQAVVVTVNDVDEDVNAAPEITSGATAEVAENIDVATVVYDAAATDADGDTLTYSLAGADAAAFTIDAATGEVRFVASPDFETQDSYNISVVATDPDGASDSQDVVITVTDVDEAAVVDLDAADNDANPNTPNLIDAAADDYMFTDDAAVGSYTIITNFEEGDLIQFSEGAEVSFTTGPDDPNDLQVIFNNEGVVSEIILDDVLADDAGLIFDEDTAEAAVGFDFFSTAEAAAVAAVDESIA